jgi:hypothetical protein
MKSVLMFSSFTPASMSAALIAAMVSLTFCWAFRTSLSRAFTPRDMTAVSALTRTSPVPLTVILVSARAVVAARIKTMDRKIAISFFMRITVLSAGKQTFPFPTLYPKHGK